MDEPHVEDSTVGRALATLGDSWTLLILQRAFLGVRRFGGWRAALGISESVLAGRLRELVAAGVLVPAPYRDGGRARVEYRLTDRGLDLWSLLVTIWSWERAWVPRTPPASEPLPDLVHGGCGRAVDAVLACGTCGAAVGARDTATTRLAGRVAAASPPRRHPRRTRGALPDDPLSAFPGALEVLGDRWGTAAVAAAMLGVRTFSGFQRELGVSPDVLSDRLRRFVAHGVLVPSGRDYRLTDKGRATFPILITLVAWGDRWLADGGCRPALEVRHRACGAVLVPDLRCSGCTAVLERREVRFTGP